MKSYPFRKRLRFGTASTGLLYSKWFEQILVHFLIWNVLFVFFFFAKWSKEALFISFVNVFTSFWIFGEKKRVSKINPILKYAVLWHSSLNIDGCYYSPNCEYGIFPILKNCKYLWSKKHKDHYPLYWNVKEYAKNTWACQKCDPWTSNNPFQEIFTQIFWPYQEKDPFNTF